MAIFDYREYLIILGDDLKSSNLFFSYFRLFFKIALVFTFVLLFYQCMYNESNWQSIFSDTETLIQNGKVTEIEGGIIKVYWALNGMKQDNPALIDFIKVGSLSDDC